MALLLPCGIDNDFIALHELSSFPDCQPGECDILIKWDSFDQARAEPGIALVQVLSDRDRQTHALDARKFGRVRDRQGKWLRPTEKNRACGPHQYFGANVCLAAAAFAQEAVRESNGKDDE